MKIILLLIVILAIGGGLYAQDLITTVPFKWWMNQIILPVAFDDTGDTLNFQLDTGANPSLIDLATAQRLSLIVRPARHAPGREDATLSADFVAPLHDLKIGDLVVDSLFALTVDLSLSSRYLGFPLHGVLGYSFLKNRIVQIDYRRQVVHFFNAAPYVPEGHGNVTVPMVLTEGGTTPIISGLAVNDKTLSVGIDTGSSFSLLLYPNTVSDLGLADYMDSMVADSILHGEADETDVLRGYRADVIIDSAHFPNVSVEFARKWPHQEDDEWDGTLGNGFFHNRRLTLDYKDGQISIEK